MRSVTCDWEEFEIRLRFVFDGEIAEDRAEDMRIVGSEVISDFNEPWTIKEEIERLDFPGDRRSRALSLTAYARKE
ncbi:hypothetical protein ED21_17887 [Erythrobacter sp. SD-21]|nr:hypothetical protein ED21_17887 [Erythrobacter sp. SD-21]